MKPPRAGGLVFLLGVGGLHVWLPGPGAGGQAPATGTAQAACGSCHALPPDTGAHKRHVETTSATPLECRTCHFTEDFDGTHMDGAVTVAFDPRAGAGARWSEQRCTTVACHSNGRRQFRAMSWAGAAATCATCHDDETSRDSRLSGRHVHHLRQGVGCADCHGSVVRRDKSIAAPDLHVNGHVDVRVLAGRYQDGSCHPACHEARSW